MPAGGRTWPAPAVISRAGPGICSAGMRASGFPGPGPGRPAQGSGCPPGSQAGPPGGQVRRSRSASPARFRGTCRSPLPAVRARAARPGGFPARRRSVPAGCRAVAGAGRGGRSRRRISRLSPGGPAPQRHGRARCRLIRRSPGRLRRAGARGKEQRPVRLGCGPAQRPRGDDVHDGQPVWAGR
jgi:hypothetical protein